MALKKEKHSMPIQAPEVRIGNFDEVALGYPVELAMEEAARCLNCKNKPCITACPVNVDIPGFLMEVKAGNFEQAYQIISRSSSLPAVCGRVCPQESQCESRCSMGVKFEPVAIGRLERFVADYHNAADVTPPARPEPNGHRVAIVGSGPGGLTCAGDLARMGYAVTVFEALHTPGGVLVYGIPEFRLPKSIVAREVEILKALGVEICTNTVIGRTMTVDELFADGYEAVFIASGAGLPNFMGIPGESCNGVYSANEYLTRANLMKAYRTDAATPIQRGGRVAVIGGGNVAMDAARTALRLGAEEVSIVYRRSMEELPARREEVEHAMEEGIVFRLLENPTAIIPCYNENNPKDCKNGFVTGLRCVKMELGEPDARGRRRPVAVTGSEHILAVDTVIIAIGTSPNPLIKATTAGLETESWGGLIVDADGLTTRTGVYAGGDVVTGAATVISAMGAGKTAAAAIDRDLRSKQAEEPVA